MMLMRTNSPLRALTALAAALVLVLVLSLVAAGCGGGDDDGGGDASPDGLLDEAVSKKLTSADVDLRVAGDVPGFPILGSELAVTAKGPIESNGPDRLPDADLRVSLEGGGQSFPARLTAVDGRAFVDFQLRPYEVDPAMLERFGLDGDDSGGGEGGSGGKALSLSQLGIDPSGWLRGVETSDGEEIDGDETTLVTGRVRTEAVVEDLVELAGARAGDDLPELGDDDVAAVADAVDRLAVEVNVDDGGYPRRVHAELDFTVPDSVKRTAIEDGSVTFDLRLSAIDEATVDVRPPTDPDDLSSLLDFVGVIFGIEEPADLWETPS